MFIYSVSLLVIFIRPLDIQAWQWADEAMYYANSQSILNYTTEGPWLGPFNKIVLSKTPFFSVFLAAVQLTGIPLRLAEFLLYAPLPILFAIALKPFDTRTSSVVILASLLLLFVPSIASEFRLLRGTLFGALALLCLILQTGFLIRVSKNQGRWWLWALGCGLSAGLAIVTREEAIWLLIPCCTSLLCTLMIAHRSRQWVIYCVSIAAFIGGYKVPIETFSYLNLSSYGIDAPSLRQHPDYKNLYSTLTSLEPASREKYVPILSNTRMLAYANSNHFAELKPFLEGSAGDAIATNKAHFYLNNWDEKKGREFFVSNFEFALADAIILSGRDSGSDFLQFCRSVTDELDRAVELGLIQQGPKGISLLPPISLNDTREIVSAMFLSLKLLLSAKGVDQIYSDRTTDLSIEREWHSSLRTWSPTEGKARDSIFQAFYQEALLKVLPFIYVLALVLLPISAVYLITIKHGELLLYLAIMLVSGSALGAFSGVMGILHTIAWPALNWPNAYNQLGYFPFHYLLLVASFIIMRGVSLLIDARKTKI